MAPRRLRPRSIVGLVLQENRCWPTVQPPRLWHITSIAVLCAKPFNPETVMLKWALIFALISIVAGILGFSGIAAGAAGLAKVLFVVALVVFLIFLCLGLFVVKKVVD